MVVLRPEVLRFAPGSSGGAVSLVQTGGRLLGVFADRSTAALESVSIPIGPHLPDQADPQIVDVIDVAPPLSAAFGRHVLAAGGGSVGLLYEDTVSSERTILKLATRAFDETQWTVDALEPEGVPVGLLPSPRGGFDAFWASGGLLRRSAPAGSTPFLTSFDPSGSAPAAGSDAFSAYNRLDGSLYAVLRSADGYLVRRYGGVGPVEASLALPAGGVAIASWDPGSRRILLLQAATEESPSPSTVTLSNGTSRVQLLAGPRPSAFLFLFDESSTSGSGSRVSVIAPSASFGLPGQRYRKATLFSSDRPIEGFAGAATPDALYLLVQSGGMAVVRAAVRGPAAPVN